MGARVLCSCGEQKIERERNLSEKEKEDCDSMRPDQDDNDDSSPLVVRSRFRAAQLSLGMLFSCLTGGRRSPFGIYLYFQSCLTEKVQQTLYTN
jgi:hypothetical protein